MDEILHRIETMVTPGTVIPKPKARADYTVKGWGRRRGERALIYRIPNHKNPDCPYEKGITESEFVKAFNHLDETGHFNFSWFKSNMIRCKKEGGCNFTSIGSIFEILGYAKHSEEGYRKISIC